jgi:nucleoside-diphosphate-sugar epimerase
MDEDRADAVVRTVARRGDMRVLLTGATGFIGSHVARLASAEGHEVVCLVRPGASFRRIEDVRKRLRVLEGGLGDARELASALRDPVPDVCIHLAWYAEPALYLEARENVECLSSSLSFLQVLRDAGCPRVVVAGTSYEYDMTTGVVSETSPILPASLYAASKHALFLTASRLDRSWSVAAARIFCVYGPWEDERRLVPYVVSKLLAGEACELTTGEQVRDYSHVEDIAGAIWALAKSSVEGPVNVASSHPVSIAALAERVGEIVGRPELVKIGARPSTGEEAPLLVANTDRLRHEVGFEPQFDLASGLAHTVAWWRSRPS